METSETREPVYDVMKGIGIILMLIGHMPPSDWLYHIIYSFHMPLFFLIAGSFASLGIDSRTACKKDFKRLLLPVFVTLAIIIGLSPLYYLIDGNFNNTIAQLLSLFWLGDTVENRWGLVAIDSMWFLVALFWTRCIFRWICKSCDRISKFHDEIVLLICITLSILAIELHKVLPYFPWGFLMGVSAIQFYALGWYLKRHCISKWVCMVFVFIWFIALRYGSLDLVQYHYGCYPLDVVGAVGATILVYFISNAICSYTTISSKLFQWFGCNSLLILCVNTIDRKTCFVRAIKYLFGIELIGFNSVMFHYLIELIMIVVIVYFSLFKKIFGTKQWKDI